MSQCGSEGARISVSRLASLVDTCDVGDDGMLGDIRGEQQGAQGGDHKTKDKKRITFAFSVARREAGATPHVNITYIL